MITYIKGDAIVALENKEIFYLIHQCNFTHGMGAGFAKYLANRFPLIKVTDKTFRGSFTIPPGKTEGLFTVNNIIENHNIVNFYTQIHPGAPFHSYDNFNVRCERLKNACNAFYTKCLYDMYVIDDLEEDLSFITVGMPLIASGMAADKKLKGSMSDLEYFQKYIEPIILDTDLNKFSLFVYYL